MRNLLIIIFTLALVSCGRTPQQKQKRITENVNEELNYNVDKIVLLSNIENLPIKKVSTTMQGYFNAMYDKDFDLEKAEDYQSLINSISKNTGLSSKKVSSLIFAYVYEMRTKEEIEDEYIEELQEIEKDYNDSFYYR